MKLQSMLRRFPVRACVSVLILSWAGVSATQAAVFDAAFDFSNGGAGGTNPSALGWEYWSDISVEGDLKMEWGDFSPGDFPNEDGWIRNDGAAAHRGWTKLTTLAGVPAQFDLQVGDVTSHGASGGPGDFTRILWRADATTAGDYSVDISAWPVRGGAAFPVNVVQRIAGAQTEIFSTSLDTDFGQSRANPEVIADDFMITLNEGDYLRVDVKNDYAGINFTLTSGATLPDSTEFTWNNDASGDWNEQNWNINGSPFGPLIPNDTRHTAIFGDAIQHSRTVFTDEPVTVKAIQFLNTHTYAVGGTGSVNLNSGTSAPKSAIDVFVGHHQFQAEVNLEVDTDVTVVGGNSLTFNNTLNLGGNTLTKLGDGTLGIRNTLATGGGTVDLQQGTLAGNGAVGGDVNNSGGTISPGDSALSTSGVPEPSTALLLLTGGLLTFWSWTRRKCDPDN